MPPMCENVPPAVREVNWTRSNTWALRGASNPLNTGGPDEESRTLTVPQYTMAVGGYLNVTDGWQGSNVEYRLVAGNKTWTRDIEGAGGGGLPGLGGGAANDANSTEFKSHEEWPNEAPHWGDWTLTVSSDDAREIDGDLKFYVLLACGGRFS